MNNPDHDSLMPLSKFLYLLTVHRRLRQEILKEMLSGNLHRLRHKAVLFFQLLKADWQIKRTIRGLADYLYDEEFGSFPSLERRIYACERVLQADIAWMDRQDELGFEWENLRF